MCYLAYCTIYSSSGGFPIVPACASEINRRYYSGHRHDCEYIVPVPVPVLGVRDALHSVDADTTKKNNSWGCSVPYLNYINCQVIEGGMEGEYNGW